MTRRERLEMVIRGEITPELVADCRRELAKLDERSAQALAKSKESAQYKENKEYEERICEILGEEPMQIGKIAEALGVDISRQRLTAICTNLVRERRISVMDIKVKGKGTRRAYHRQVLFI